MRFNKYLTEFLGTFFLVLIIAAVIKNNEGVMGPLLIGAGLSGLIYAGYHISGAHYNPIVTLGACLLKLCKWSDAPGYMLAQFLAALSASYLALELFQDPVTVLHANTPYLFVAEILGSFFLVYVIFNVAAVPLNTPNSYYGLAIGTTVTTLAYIFGGTSGAAFNPAVATGLGLINFVAPSDVGCIIISNIIGALVATAVFYRLNKLHLQKSIQR
nr:putative glycerol uptake facilitator [uncultured bacterium]